MSDLWDDGASVAAFGEDFTCRRCGARTQFVKSYRESVADDIMGHQKDAQMVQAYRRFLPRTRLGPTVGRPRRMLAIGITPGGSAALWLRLFPQVEYVGVDINLGGVSAAVRRHLGACGSARWALHRRDVFEPETFRDLGRFDFIIDDGPHGPKATVPLFDVLWPQLNRGGVYVIEDWHHDHLEPERHIAELARRVIGPDWRESMPRQDAPFRLTANRAFIALEKL